MGRASFLTTGFAYQCCLLFIMVFFLNFKFAIKERPDETFVSDVRKIPHKLPKIPFTKFKKDIAEYHQLYLQD